LKPQSWVFAISGTFFGLLVGWIIGSQRVGPALAPPVQTTAAAQPSAPAPAPIDPQKVATLEAKAKAEPGNVAVRVELANVFYDGERYDLALPWYEAAFTLDPTSSSVSNDLATCYHYTKQPDKALAQLDKSLKINPTDVQALLNQGVVRAFGKNDLSGAAEAWQKVIAIAPSSPEARSAQQGLDGIKSQHASTPAGAGAPGGGGS
jgi:tetratricopeptide (TPR) repeat protein